jgi:hypothetical protein
MDSYRPAYWTTIYFLSIVMSRFGLRVGAAALFLGFAIWATLGPPQPTSHVNLFRAWVVK